MSNFEYAYNYLVNRGWKPDQPVSAIADQPVQPSRLPDNTGSIASFFGEPAPPVDSIVDTAPIVHTAPQQSNALADMFS